MSKTIGKFLMNLPFWTSHEAHSMKLIVRNSLHETHTVLVSACLEIHLDSKPLEPSELAVILSPRSVFSRKLE